LTSCKPVSCSRRTLYHGVGKYEHKFGIVISQTKNKMRYDEQRKNGQNTESVAAEESHDGRGLLKCDDTRAETRFRLSGETDESIEIGGGVSSVDY